MIDVSVIIPVYNTPEKILSETVNSVLDQSFSYFELIIVDDGSNDETRAMLDRLSDERIRVIHRPNGGVACARNTGIASARGRFIALLDHDDLWHPDKLARQKQMLDESPETVLVYSQIEVFGVSDTIQIPEYAEVGDNAFLSELEQNRIQSMSCVMFRRDVVERNNIQLRPEFVPCDDWDFYLQIAKYGRFRCSSGVPVYYRLHSGNQSADVCRMYKAGISVLENILSGVDDIAQALSISRKEITGSARKHLAKHWRGLARSSYLEHKYSQAAEYAARELKCRFSLKAVIVFAAATIGSRLGRNSG